MLKKFIKAIEDSIRHRTSTTSTLRYAIMHEMKFIASETEAEYESKKQEILSAHQIGGDIRASEVKRIIGVITIFKFDTSA